MSASKGPSGVRLDPADKTDRAIIARQVKAARQAGRDGRDRAKSTRGRADLEAAFDEGAAEAAADEAQPTKDQGGEQPAAGGSTARRTWNGLRRMGPGWQSARPTSPARLPSRASDAGGFLAGLLLYTGVVIYIRYGPEGWRGWLSAKFLNRPMDVPGSAKGSSAAKGAPGTADGKSRFV